MEISLVPHAKVRIDSILKFPEELLLYSILAFTSSFERKASFATLSKTHAFHIFLVDSTDLPKGTAFEICFSQGVNNIKSLTSFISGWAVCTSQKRVHLGEKPKYLAPTTVLTVQVKMFLVSMRLFFVQAVFVFHSSGLIFCILVFTSSIS